jgi:hypothetical protein
MKKNLINLIAVLIVANAGYSLLMVLAESTGTLSGAWLFLVSTVLYLLAGIGLLLKKNWSIVLYWLALILGIANAIQAGRSLAQLDFDTIFFAIEIIVGVFLAMQWGKLSKVEAPQQMSV